MFNQGQHGPLNPHTVANMSLTRSVARLMNHQPVSRMRNHGIVVHSFLCLMSKWRWISIFIHLCHWTLNVTSSTESLHCGGTAARSLLPVRREGGRERVGRRWRRNERNNLLIKRRMNPGGCVPFTNKLICQDWLVLLIVGQIQGECKSCVNATQRGAESRRERRALVAKTDICRSDSSASGGGGCREGRTCRKSWEGKVTRAESTAGNQMPLEAGERDGWGGGGRVDGTLVNTDTLLIYFSVKANLAANCRVRRQMQCLRGCICSGDCRSG